MKKQTYKKMFTVATASAMAAGAVVAVAPAQADAAKSFSDVSVNNGHYENIMNLTGREVITGYEDGTYRPGDSIKRGNAAKIIAGVLGLDTVNVTNPGFSDVSVNNSNYGAIAALANAGIIGGYEGKFNPNGTLTRGQMAKIISNAFNLTGGDDIVFPFTDVKPQYKADIANLYANGVTTGTTSTTFSEGDFVTRGQLASFVVRAEQKMTLAKTTVEAAVKVLTVNDNSVTIDGEDFDVAPHLKEVFNNKNAAALKESNVELVVEYTIEKVAAIAPQNARGRGTIVGIKGLEITQSGTSFSSGNTDVGKLTISAQDVAISNTKATALNVKEGSTATFNNVEATDVNVAPSGIATFNDVKVTNLAVESTGQVILNNVVVTEIKAAANSTITLSGTQVDKVTVAEGAKITIDANTVLKTIVVPAGKKIEDVITNYEAVKDQLTNVTVETAPGGSTGGGGGGGSTDSDRDDTTDEDIEGYVERAQKAVVGLNKEIKITSSISLDTQVSPKVLTIDITTDSGIYTWASLAADVDKLVAHLGPIKPDTEKYVSSITIEGTEIKNLQASKLQTGELLAEELFGVPLELDDLLNTKLDFRNKIKDGTTSTVVVKFNDSDRIETYTVKVKNEKNQ